MYEAVEQLLEWINVSIKRKQFLFWMPTSSPLNQVSLLCKRWNHPCLASGVLCVTAPWLVCYGGSGQALRRSESWTFLPRQALRECSKLRTQQSSWRPARTSSSSESCHNILPPIVQSGLGLAMLVLLSLFPPTLFLCDMNMEWE